MLVMDFKVYNVFKILLAAEVVLLFIQFWLSVSVNLYVTIPMLRPFDIPRVIQAVFKSFRRSLTELVISLGAILII